MTSHFSSLLCHTEVSIIAIIIIIIIIIINIIINICSRVSVWKCEVNDCILCELKMCSSIPTLRYTLHYYIYALSIFSASQIILWPVQTLQSERLVSLVSYPKRKCSRGACRQSKYVLSCYITNSITFPPANSLWTNRGGESCRHITSLSSIDGIITVKTLLYNKLTENKVST